MSVTEAAAGFVLPDLRDSVQFLGGFFDQIAMDNNMDELMVCTNEAQDEVALAFTVIDELNAGKKVKAAADMARFQQNLQVVINDCMSMQDDILRLKAWTSIFSDQTELVSTITKNILKKPIKVTNDIKATEADWSSGNYNQSGADFAKLMEIGLGPIPTMMGELMPMIDLLSVPEFLAGFMEGMVGESDLTEIESCYSGVTPLVHYAQSAISDVLHLQIVKAIENLEAFIYHFQLDLAPCTHMQDDLKSIESWAAQFKNPAALIPEITKHVLFHKKKIESDWTTEKSDWASGLYVQAGKEMADIVTLVFGPITPAPADAFLQ